MAKHNHKVGDIVDVYYDWTNKECYEAKAKIISVDSKVDHLYKVIFENYENVPQGETVDRFIY